MSQSDTNGAPQASSSTENGRRSDFLAELGFEPPATARLDVAEALWIDAKTPRGAGDGLGSIRWSTPPDTPRAATTVELALEFETDPAGIEVGGALYLQAPPFWGWSTPQSDDPDGLGYTTVTTEAEGVVLVPRTVDEQLLQVEVTGRALRGGDRVQIVYGSGSAGARADRFAERASRFEVAVDADGDGVRELIGESLELSIAPGPPARLLAFLPATARAGEDVELTVALVDGRGNRTPMTERTLELTVRDGEAREVASLTLEPGEDHRRLELPAGDGGTVRYIVSGDDSALTAETNPMRVSQARRVLWADLQNHSALSDGTGEPEDLYAYADEIAALDVYALTDHDHWGLRPLDEHPALWDRVLAAADGAGTPGRFLALAGYEWTSWIFGHRHVVFFGDERPLLSSFDLDFDEPRELWAGLRGKRAVSIPHTLAGGPVAVDWERAPDPEVEPVVELVSVHGASDAPDSPRRIYSAEDGHWFTDVLDRGYRYGVLGSTDGHDGHPGLAHLVAPSGGLAGILAEEATAESVLEAIRARRTFATSGPRILVRTSLGSQPMGSVLKAADLGEEPAMFLEAFAVAPLESIDLIDRSGPLVSFALEGERDVRTTLPIPRVEPGDVIWVRVVQTDGHAAWTSPYFFD
ncbi:MAG: DUF3604 domain-containing protein [Planctomycetota bacterium]